MKSFVFSVLVWSLSVGTIALPMRSAHADAGDALWGMFSEGTINGNVRNYLNFRNFETRPDQRAYALGGKLFAETAPMGGLQIGGAFYFSNDLQSKRDDPRKRLGTLPEDIEILGEAYLKYTALSTSATFGRIKVNTPFANPSDAFIVPITFQGLHISNKSIEGLTVDAIYLRDFKNRSSDKFEDIGRFVGNRLSGLDRDNASDRGTGILGATYQTGPTKLEAWGYLFEDYFSTFYAAGSRTLPKLGEIEPYAAAQGFYQRDANDERFGDVNVRGFGVQLGARFESFDLSFAYTDVQQDSGAFRNGALLAPFSFATGPLYTNSMLQTLENTDSGDAYKITLSYRGIPNTVAKASFAAYELDNSRNLREVNLDLEYGFDALVKGLSFRVRVAFVDSGDRSRKVINVRNQLQFAF